ncbi:MAG: YhfC family glutamic-type intramembrane protease [Caldilineaceae bacterium]|nr:YhfC family glutamic-type intramembrane protease [Caldilineaceae bacterium]
MTIAILSLIVALPVVASILCQRHSRAQWGSLFFGFGAFAVNGLVRIPLTMEQVLATPLFRELLAFFPDILMRVPTAWIMYAFMLALVREGIRWLILFFVATNVRTWKEGVMFGLGYSCLVAVQHLGTFVSYYSEATELFQSSIVETIKFVNNTIPWLEALQLALNWGVLETVFNVGTSLVVMFSVRRRDVWLLLAAVLWYVVFSELPRAMFFYFAGLEVGGIPSYYVSRTIILLTTTFVVLLPFFLLFRQSRAEGVSKIMTPNAAIGAAVLVGLAWILVILYMTFRGWFFFFGLIE